MRIPVLVKALRQAGLIILQVAVCILCFFPVYWIFIMSVQPRNNVFAFPPIFIPRDLTLDNYLVVLRERPILQWLWNTILVSVSSSVLSIAISALGAYSLSRFRYRGRALITFLLLMSQMLPVTLLMVPIYMIFRELGLFDTLHGLVLAYTTITVPLCIWMLKGFFDSVPYEIEEAAMIDGCSRLETLFRIVLPLSLPGLAATTGYAIVSAWNEYGLALILINNDSRRVLSVGLANFLGSELGISYEKIAAAAIMMVLPELLLFIALQRQLIQGLTAGGVKG